MDPKTRSKLDAYFHTFNTDDDVAHQALWAPDMAFFGSLIKATVQGPGSTKGVFKAVRDGMGMRRMRPIRWFGDAPQVGVLTTFEGVRGEPSQEGALLFKFDGQGLIERLAAHWDPGAFLKAKERPGEPMPPRVALEEKDPRVKATLNTYFRTFNDGDEAQHYSVVHPDMVFFGSLSHVETEGLASAKGVFRSVRESLGIRTFEAKRYFGDYPEVTVLLDLCREAGRGKAEAMMTFRFNEAGLVTRITVLWNPLPFLKGL
jgi:hypothetical protein